MQNQAARSRAAAKVVSTVQDEKEKGKMMKEERASRSLENFSPFISWRLSQEFFLSGLLPLSIRSDWKVVCGNCGGEWSRLEGRKRASQPRATKLKENA